MRAERQTARLNECRLDVTQCVEQAVRRRAPLKLLDHNVAN